MASLELVATIDADNPVEGDLRIFNNQMRLIDGPAEAAQDIRTALRFFKGEWFLNTDEGFPWFENVLIKNPDLNLLRAMFKKVIEGRRFVDSVASLTVSLDRNTRLASLVFVAHLKTGGFVDSTKFPPFIVELP